MRKLLYVSILLLSLVAAQFEGDTYGDVTGVGGTAEDLKK
jgi:hypothetical protein